jgi:hypothetical protein
MKQKPKVGQTVCALHISERTGQGDRAPINMRVVRVGRRYFECETLSRAFRIEFHLDTWRQKSDYSPDYRLYASREEWEAEKRQSELVEWFKRIFNTYASPKYTLAALEAARAILEEDEKGAGK